MLGPGFVFITGGCSQGVGGGRGSADYIIKTNTVKTGRSCRQCILSLAGLTLLQQPHQKTL